MLQAYAGKVRSDLDHNALKPAAWRVDNYLEGEDEADVGIGALVCCTRLWLLLD